MVQKATVIKLFSLTGAKRKGKLARYICVFLLSLSALSTQVDEDPVFGKKKKQKILSTILIFAYIKNTWFEFSQNKTECLSRIFVVNRMASGFFLSIFLPSTEEPALYKFQPNIQTSREEQ